MEKKSYIQNALDLFKANLGKIITSEQLASIPGKNGKPISHNIRRVFELRDEQGYKIANHKNNEETGLNLKVDQWVLLADEPDKTLIRNRQINKRLRIKVFKRDNFSCRTCGRDASDDDPFSFGRKIKLHLGHINSLIGQIRGKNELVSELTEDTAITQCNVCNEGFQDDDIPSIDWEKKLRNLTHAEKKKIYLILKKEL